MEELEKLVEILRGLAESYDKAQCDIMDEISPLEDKKETYGKMWDHAMYSVNHINSLIELIKEVDSLP